MRKIMVMAMIMMLALSCFLFVGCAGNSQAKAGPALDFVSFNRFAVKNGYIFQSLEQNTLYRVPEDGGDKLLLANDVEEFFVGSDWVYYTTNSEIRKIRIDATEDTQIFEGKTGLCRIAGDVIYFIYYPDEGESDTYCIKTDGTDMRRAYYPFVCSAIYNGKTYTFAGDTMIVMDVLGNDNSIKSFDLDIPLPESGLRWDGGACYAHDDWIYYNARLEDLNIYETIRTDIRKVRINGEDDQLFVKNGYIREISDGYVYYQDNSNGAAWCRIKTDGTDNKRDFLPENAYEYIGSSENWTYFSQGSNYDQRTYWRMNEDKSVTEQITWI